MKNLIIGLIFLLIGSATGGFLALAYGWNLGAAAGLIIGSQAGVCLAAETAEEQGLVSDAEQIDALVATAVRKVSDRSPPIPANTGLVWIEDSSQCRDMVRQLVEGPETMAQGDLEK